MKAESRGREVGSRLAHNQEIAGSNPVPATESSGVGAYHMVCIAIPDAMFADGTSMLLSQAINIFGYEHTPEGDESAMTKARPFLLGWARNPSGGWKTHGLISADPANATFHVERRIDFGRWEDWD
jgi:hypothetical protein